MEIKDLVNRGNDDAFEQRNMGADPFTLAKRMDKPREILSTSEAFPANGMEMFDMPEEKLSETSVEPPTSMLGQFLGKEVSQEEKVKVQDTDIPGQLKALGLSDLAPKLSLTTFGKLSLINKLRENLGDQFFQDPRVQKLLDSFDTLVDEKGSKDKLVTERGKRTLEFLRNQFK